MKQYILGLDNQNMVMHWKGEIPHISKHTHTLFLVLCQKKEPQLWHEILYIENLLLCFCNKYCDTHTHRRLT